MIDDRHAWRVIARIHAELKRQSIMGGIRNSIPSPDDMGRVAVVGSIDLAALADATERALIDVFARADQS